MNDDRTTLASAYVDGDVTADERALVEGDAELVAEVDRLRQVRALLGDVEPSPISQREEHLAVALGAWDRLPETERGGAAGDATPRSVRRGATGTVTTLGSTSSRRRPAMNRRLLGAAAAITLVLAGGIVLQSVSSDDDQEQSDATSGTTGEDASSLDAASSAESADPESADAETAIAQSDAADEDATNEDATAESSESSTGDTLATGIDDAAPPGERTLDLLQTPDDLATFAAASVGAPVSPDVPAATSAPIGNDNTALLDAELPLCLGADYVVGPAFYRGVEVVVGVDEGRELALAYLAEDCSEVARARLP